MTYRLHHVHLICKDLEEMIAFFTGVIGADLIERRNFGTAQGAAMDLQGNTINLRVAREGEEIVDPGIRSRYGYDHLGLEVDDLDAVHKDLSGRGYEFFMPPTDIPGLKIAFFRGPEAITIELVQTL